MEMIVSVLSATRRDIGAPDAYEEWSRPLAEQFRAAPTAWQIQLLQDLSITKDHDPSIPKEDPDDYVRAIPRPDPIPRVSHAHHVFPTTEVMLLLLLMSLVWAIGSAVYGVWKGWW